MAGYAFSLREQLKRFRTSYRTDEAGHWVWRGEVAESYPDRRLSPQLYIGGRQTVSAHWWSFTYLIGPVERGWDPTPKCGEELCVNPTHLKLVPPGERGKIKE